MSSTQETTRWYVVLMDLNWDRVLYIVTIAAALWMGSFLGTLLPGVN